MKQKLTFLLTAVLLLTGMTLQAQSRAEASIDFSEQGYANSQDFDGVVIDINDDASIVFNKGTGNNGPKYYNTGTAIRAYGGNNFVVSANGTISSIELTFGSGDGSNAITTEVGSFSTNTWTGNANEVTFTVGGSSGHRRIKAVAVTYTSGGGQQQTVATPTFSPAGGTYFETQSVSISCATEGATIHYTTDGSEPTESSATYYNPLDINVTTTVKAKAFMSGYTESNTATATYTFPTLVTIAEAKALAVNEYALVQGVVTFIDGRNVYVQDGTGGICLFLNSGTVPSALALGDMVQAYGKRANYNGLLELSYINGSNANEFSILSSGNALPLAVKTIAEILEGGSDALQCTRVKIESAIIGAINTSGNTPLTQGESSTNIYKVPALTDIAEGDEVDVTGVVGYFNVAQIRVALANDIVLSYVPDPQLNVSPTQLSDLRYTYNNGPSAAKTFTVSGSDLDADITLTAPAQFELSLSPANGYFDSDALSPVNGTVTETTVYVRMKAGLAVGDYSGNLTVVSGDLSQSVALSGTVSEQPVVATPTFSPDGGNFISAQTVSISCETENATIHYTTDGSEPTESSTVYSQPFTVSVTTTVKAIAVAPTYANSTVGEATYTINTPITIAQARALAANAYACVEGIVTFIDGRNVYIQDGTAGIDLYLNNNTVPSALAVGDNVRAYGRKTTFNGLVELTGINGSNENAFLILSSGNTLPLAVKTIAEINQDYSGNNLLQATRVKIENAIIGAINPSSTTVITQDGNSLNVYQIPTVEGMLQGDWVTLTGIIGCYNAPQLRVANANDIQYTHRPTLTANPTSLSGFTYDYEQGGPSEVNTFLIGGDYLTDNVAVYPSESFEVSTLVNFRPENPAMIFIPNSGHFYDITIYVRMKAGLEAGTYNEQVYAVSENADTLFISVSGTVTGGTTPPEPPTPGDGNYVRISDLGTLAEGSIVVFAARFDDNATDYYAMSNTSSGKPTGVLFTSTTSGEDEILPASIVDEESSYYWTVGITANGYTFTNANGELIGYTSSTNFATGGDNTEWNIEAATAGDGAMVPLYEGFTITNVNVTNRAFALNSSHNYGPYSTQNLNNSGYNFYLDLFVKTEGGEPPMPTVATPTFTPAEGTYYEEQTVSIACATDGATIHYTLDGTDPTESSPVYTSPLTISETVTIKAIAVKDEYNDSNIATATYTIQLGFVTIFNQDWEGEMNGWTFVDVEGNASWSVAQYSGNHYAYANGYNQGANEDWCISPAFNLNAYANPTLSFRTAKNYTGNDLEVYFSNDYDGSDPTNATWTALTCNLSTGGYAWTESGDIDLGSFSGTNCFIGFKYTCEEGGAAAWEVDDILLIGQTSDPVVTVSPLTLSGFSYIEGNGPSDEQSFTVSGMNLSGNVTVSEATDYEISLASGNDFTAQTTLTLSPSGGTIEEVTVYVRLKAGLEVGDYNDEDITITSADVDEIDVTCNGSVVEAPVPGDDYVRISDVSQLVAGNKVILAARYNDTENAYLAASNTTTSGKLTTTEFTSTMNGTDEIIPASILADEDNYYWTVGVTENGYTFTNANGDVIGYGNNGTNFVMNGEKTEWTITTGVSAPESMVPGYFGFNIVNFVSDGRAFALRVTESESVVKAYATSNMTNSEYNFFLDIFMQGEGGEPPMPTVAAPTFTPAAGTYYETIDVTLSCATNGATIYYSFDSENGPWEEYEEAITIDEDMTIWAYAEKDDYNDSPVVSAEYIIQDDVVIIFNQDWEEDWHGWTERCVVGDSLWRIASYGGNHYAYANGYNHDATEDWLISPAFDLDSYNDVVLTFVTAKNYNGPDIEVYFSNDYDGQDPTTATWEELECELSVGSWTWTESGEISLDGYNGTNCYIGFKYTSTDDEAAGWEVDDIMLVSGSNTNPTLTATPNSINGFSYVEGEGPSASATYTLTAANLEGEGDITVTVTEGFEISLDDEYYGDELEIAYADGQIVDQPVTIYVRMAEGLEIGSYEGTITHEGGEAYTEVSLAGTVHSEDEPAIEAFMPLYIQGNNGSNNNRVPVATAVYLANLEPNTTYRYTNQFVDDNDGPETAGAGNVIYANLDGFYRSTSPSLSTEGGYGEFTTDDDGEAFAWFINEPTANARFTPGNHVYLRIRINDGHDGTTVDQIFTTDDYATVLNFGNEYGENQGTAFYAKSDEASMTFAMMFATDDDWRPTYSTPIETTGVDYGGINQYADFYKEEVAGNNGWFGGILPNDNENGINVIWILDMESYVINDYYTENGEWHPEAQTINPANGLDEPIFIDLTYDGVEEQEVEANVKVWSAGHEFIVENSDNAHYTMTVYNLLGQPMMQRQINAGSTERIGHSLATGLYVVNLQNSLNKVAVKVIVK